jgi:hypothetical protein
MTEMKTGQILKCPHCGKPEESPVEDYVVQGRFAQLGPESRVEDQCGWCDGHFSVERVDQDTYCVEAA